MLPASNTGSGTNVGVPDVCNTPVGTATSPIPYVNTAMQGQSTNAAKTVYVTMMPALNTGSSVASSNGDEAGTAHGNICGQSAYTQGNAIVYVESMPGINLTSMTTHNNKNCGSGAVVSPGAANVFFTDRRALVPPMGRMHAIDGRGLLHSAERIAGPSLVDGRQLLPTVGYLRARFIAPASASELLATLARWHDCRALVLDLRATPGGTLDGARRLAGVFLPLGTRLAQLCQHDGGERLLTAGRRNPIDLPLTIMIDDGTASAAEIVAATLQHHSRARIVGCRSYGKASVQQVLTTEQGVGYATIAEVRLPDGAAIDGVGVSAVRDA
jgi:carboxyl-terminal processing protease